MKSTILLSIALCPSVWSATALAGQSESAAKPNFIFTTDNGPWIRFKHHGGSALPLRDGKGTTFEGGQRVPCIMWGPGRIPAGTSSDEFASTPDLLPTITSLAGSELPQKNRIDGHDLTKTIMGDAPSPRTELIYYSARGSLEGLRQGDWKLLIKMPRVEQAKRDKAKTSQPQIMLFNLADDLSETINLADKNPAKVKALRARMIELDDEITANARSVWRKN